MLLNLTQLLTRIHTRSNLVQIFIQQLLSKEFERKFALPNFSTRNSRSESFWRLTRASDVLSRRRRFARRALSCCLILVTILLKFLLWIVSWLRLSYPQEDSPVRAVIRLHTPRAWLSISISTVAQPQPKYTNQNGIHHNVPFIFQF